MAKTGQGDDPWGNHRIGFEGIFKIKRSEVGMDKMLEAAGDEIQDARLFIRTAKTLEFYVSDMSRKLFIKDVLNDL